MYLELYLDPGSCGGNTPSTGPKSLVPGESSCGGKRAKYVHEITLWLIRQKFCLPELTWLFTCKSFY